MERRALIDGDVQPGGRAPAPGALALVQAFVNTVDREHGPDLADEPGGLTAWARARGFTEPVDAAEGREVREALRVLLWRNGSHGDEASAERAAAVLDAAAARGRLRARFGPARLEPRKGDALGAVLAAAFGAMADGSWARLKACPGDRCGWAYYDRSVNGASQWCSMRVCGQRAKARAYYRRRRT